MKKRIGKLAIFAAIVAGDVLLRQTGIGCVFRYLFGVTCPGCGMGRAVEALFRLDFSAAWQWHPMVFSLPIILLYLFKDGPLFRDRRWDTAVLIAIGAGFLINYVVNWNNPNLLLN